MQQLADEADVTTVLSLGGSLGAAVARVCEASDQLVNISVRVGSPLSLEAAQTRVFLTFLGGRVRDLMDAEISVRLRRRLWASGKHQAYTKMQQVSRDIESARATGGWASAI